LQAEVAQQGKEMRELVIEKVLHTIRETELCDCKSSKFENFKGRDSSELQNFNLKFLHYCKPKWHNKANK
jgi:hypothetical protein